VATLTIRNLEDPLKSRLRLRAAARNRSMEEEARQILRAALQEPATPGLDLGARIRARFAPLGDTRLPIETRELVREPPALGKTAAAGANAERKPGKPPRRHA
jgi:antitoxin FitA